MRIVCWQTILIKHHTLFFSKTRKDVTNLSSAAVVISALSVKIIQPNWLPDCFMSVFFFCVFEFLWEPWVRYYLIVLWMFFTVYTVEFEDEDPELAAINIKLNSPDRSLRAIQEDEEAAEEGEEEEEEKEDRKPDHARDHGDEVFDVVNNNQGLSEEELAILSKLKFFPVFKFTWDREAVGSSLTGVTTLWSLSKLHLS